ncbi:hypothetical protein DNK06_20265 [Pseudomonas daroniae]|uniref:Chlorhexidine efflux transporter domain-containing protein n=1 Tax=Phytopseudomonas daroniae TaxID=2487519 RepID=A0A4Q9QH19_9GAMM|nr:MULTISPECIES: multidrug/biocide efflux PACE transporter [Pseudomonas]TBU72480.1 hypothetical protein DNK10_20560 [Pseudomonas daroniae]TBU73780.1 hypothetical protein DNK06_20265 [Pseudomonas daroniae]TBU79531.1 hypothetical protein DNK31_19095 [Pseudomonas sp. FRB 228]TBU88224.1 hypothetical protein DNJ99_19740 [Pseudomonas daroniae]
MSQSNQLARRSFKERVLHATLFEVIAVAVCAPLLAWAMGKSLAHMGALTLMFSAIAMLWNMIFNVMFDAAQRRMGFERGLWARISHALLFEAGLILVLVPLAAWWLSISLVAAFFLDIGLILFFLPYTLGYNWAYDSLRERYFNRREACSLACR